MSALISPAQRAWICASAEKLARYAPGVPFCSTTLKKEPPPTPTTLTTPLSAIATTMQASTRGTTRRCTAEMPSTSIASISSRILRLPRSAQIAEPPAPAMSRAQTIGLASRMMASTLAAPVNDCAPSCRVRLPSCRAMTAPNGIATSAVGRIVTLAMNHACWMNSRNWNGRRNVSRPTSRNRANKRPLCRTPATGESAAISAVPVLPGVEPSLDPRDQLRDLLRCLPVRDGVLVLDLLPVLLIERATYRGLGLQRKGVQHVQHPGLATRRSPAWGQAGRGLQLRRHSGSRSALGAGAGHGRALLGQ